MLESAFINVTLFSIFWALELLFFKLALGTGAPMICVALQQVGIAGFILCFFYLNSSLVELRELWGRSPRAVMYLFLAHVINALVGSLLGMAALVYTSATNAAFLAKCTLVSTTIFAYLFLGESIHPRKLLTVLLLLCGAFFVSTSGGMEAPRLGDLLTLGACIGWSLSNVIARGVLRNHPISGETGAFLRPLVGLPALSIFGLLFSRFSGELGAIFNISPLFSSMSYYAFYSAICTAILWVFLYRAFKRASASYVTMMSTITPCILAVLAMVFLNEKLQGARLFGALLIVSGSVLTHILRVESEGVKR